MYGIRFKDSFYHLPETLRINTNALFLRIGH